MSSPPPAFPSRLINYERLTRAIVRSFPNIQG